MHTSVCWHTVLLEDVSVTEMAEVDEVSLAPAFSSTSQQYPTGKIFHWSDFIVTFRSHLNSFLDGKISQNGPKTKN